VKDRYSLSDVVALVAALRDPETGCPWDREQTHQSIRQNFIEETYEAVEAIDRGDSGLLEEELGDVLLQVLLHAEMARQEGGFSIDDVSDRLCKKLVLRHPHIFGDVEVDGSDEVLSNWEDIKRVEKEQKTGSDAIDDVAKALPSLMRAQKIHKRAAYVGFTHSDAYGSIRDLGEKVRELGEAVQAGKGADGLGDVLFSASNVARQIGADAELCLTESCDRFAGRFRKLEELAARENIDLHTASAGQLDRLWDLAKGTQNS